MKYWPVCPAAPSSPTVSKRPVRSGSPRSWPTGVPVNSSAHTLKAYRQDFDAIATLIAGGEDRSAMALDAITIEAIRTAFARYAQTHEAASIQRCWSTWNVLRPSSTPRS